jgi:hypothetical protein
MALPIASEEQSNGIITADVPLCLNDSLITLVVTGKT